MPLFHYYYAMPFRCASAAIFAFHVLLAAFDIFDAIFISFSRVRFSSPPFSPRAILRFRFYYASLADYSMISAERFRRAFADMIRHCFRRFSVAIIFALRLLSDAITLIAAIRARIIMLISLIFLYFICLFHFFLMIRRHCRFHFFRYFLLIFRHFRHFDLR
jgi:hypothetical protein